MAQVTMKEKRGGGKGAKLGREGKMKNKNLGILLACLTYFAPKLLLQGGR